MGLYDTCKKEWKEKYIEKKNTEKQFNDFIFNFDMANKNDYIKFPVWFWFRWKCPCCGKYLKILKFEDGEITYHQYAILNQNIRFVCENCDYEYGYHFIPAVLCNP